MREKLKGNKKILIYIILAVIVPVFFLMYLLLTWLMKLVMRLLKLDLSDVVFGKEKITEPHHGDFEVENNLVPIEEALAITDRTDLRTFMLNVLKNDVSGSLSKLKEALESEDSETAHYAATVLREEINEFRSTVYSSLSEIPDEEGDEKMRTCLVTERYINEYLRQGIFSPEEECEYALRMAELGETVYKGEKRLLTYDDMYQISMRLLDAGLTDRCREWCIRLSDAFPDVKESYLAMISYCFKTGRRKGFNEGLDTLMNSGIPVDEETMEHIRAFR